MPDNIINNTVNDDNKPITKNSKIYNADGTTKDTDLGYAEVVFHKPTKAPEKEKIEEEIKPTLDKIPEPDVQSQLENGQQTTSFITKTVSGTEAIASGTFDITKQAVNTTGVLLNQGAQYMGLAAELSQKVINSFTEIVSQKTTELVLTATTYGMKWPVDVSKYSLSYFNKHIGTITKEAMMKGGLSASAYDQLKGMMKQGQEEIMKQAEQGGSTKLQLKGVEKIKDTLKDIKEGIASITDHITEGPTWVTNKTNEFINKHTENINKTLNTYKDSIVSWEQKSSQKIGEKLGKELLDEESKKIEAKTKKQIEKIQKLQTKAETEAKNQIKLAVIKLAALVGI